MNNRIATSTILLSLCLLTACASTGDIVSAPKVRLSNVEVTDLDFSGQTFLLGFDVTNPNPFPLPVKAVSYSIELDGYRFASGSTRGGFTVPSSGDANFAISVQLNLLKTAPQLLYLVGDSLKRDIPYQLEGRLSLDIPLIDTVRFDSSGAIRMQAVSRQALKIP